MFLNFLVERDLIKCKLRIKMPEALQRAFVPEDVQQLLAIIKKVRDRALVLALLRIGELLSTSLEDLNLREQWVQIFEAHKNRVGWVVYLSADTVGALKKWMRTRKYPSKFIFYGHGAGPLCYEAARAMFNIAALGHKSYTLHCLRHTYASDLLNAGMPVHCLQELLGHRRIEMTRRYARLTDNTRRQAYYKAMAIIEAGEINGHYRLDYQLLQIAKKAELLKIHHQKLHDHIETICHLAGCAHRSGDPQKAGGLYRLFAEKAP